MSFKRYYPLKIFLLQISIHIKKKLKKKKKDTAAYWHTLDIRNNYNQVSSTTIKESVNRIVFDIGSLRQV